MIILPTADSLLLAEQLSTACFSGRWAPSGSWSWTPWQSAAARSSPGRPRPPGPWRRSSSLAGSHRKHLNAVAERQRHSGEAGRQNLVGISSRTLLLLCMQPAACKTLDRVAAAVSSASHLSVPWCREGGKLRAAGRRTQSTQVQRARSSFERATLLIGCRYSVHWSKKHVDLFSHLVWWTDTFCTGWRSWCSWSSLLAGWQGRPLYTH